MTVQRTCGDSGGRRPDGQPCGAVLGLSETTGLCPNHDPELRRQARARRKAAEQSGIDYGQLGDLETVEDALRWTRTIGLALAARAIKPAEGNALLRVVSEWRANEDLRLRRDDLRDLMDQVAELKASKGRPT